jgi:hypothetical protein
MYFDGDIRVVGHIEVEKIRAALETVPETVWSSDWRKTANPNFEYSNSLWPVSLPFTNDKIFHVFHSETLSESESFIEAYKELHQQLEHMFDGTIIRSCIIRLLPNNGVRRHVDGTHPLFRYCYRLIIPIQTNDKSVFIYDNKTYRLKQGTIYDTNPYIPHSTFNGGNAIRQQAVIDLMPSSIPESEMQVKIYDWSPEQYQSLEARIPRKDRNKTLPVWQDILKNEKDFFHSNSGIFPDIQILEDDVECISIDASGYYS